MIRMLWSKLFWKERAVFSTPFSHEEAARRLRLSVKRTVFHTFFREAVVGRVSVGRVVLHRHEPFGGNPFGQYFFGKFRVHAGVTLLEGEFVAIPWPARVFLAFWFGGLVVSLLTVWSIAVSNVKSGKIDMLSAAAVFAFFTLVALVMALFAVGLVMGFRQNAREDTEYISSVIRASLEGPGT